MLRENEPTCERWAVLRGVPENEEAIRNLESMGFRILARSRLGAAIGRCGGGV